MSPARRRGALALSLGLVALALWFAAPEGLSSQDERRPHAAAARSAGPPSATTARAIVAEAPPPAPALGEDPLKAAPAPTNPQEPAELPSAAASFKGVASVGRLAPERDLPRTARSWIVPMELGWKGAHTEQPIASDIRYRPQRVHPQDTLFQAIVLDARGDRWVCDLPVRGLIPLELADSDEAQAVGDELFVPRAPVLLRLPDLPFPLRVELLRPDGIPSTTLVLTEVQGEVLARVE